MKRNLTQLAKELAADLLAADRNKQTGATIYAYYEPRNGTPRRVVTVIENAPDAYQALQQASQLAPTDADAVLISTTGWAAPNNDEGRDIPPSLDPNRKRCALIAARTLTRKPAATLSALALAGEPEVITDTNGNGKGPLADAIEQLAHAITARR